MGQLFSYVASNSGALVLTKNGAQKAAIVSIEDLWILDALGAQDIKADLKVAARYEPELLRNILKEKLTQTDGIKVSRDDLLKDISTLVKRLRERMRRRGENWRAVVAIERGGVFPARMIAKSLQINNYREIRIRSYHGDEKQGTPRVTGEIKGGGEGEGVLVIDDVIDSGDTAICVFEMLPECDLAAVYTKPPGLTRVIKEYRRRLIYGRKIPNKWIVFPWDQTGWDASWTPVD
jgi:xanthine phosphoribosyltransferase